MEMNKIKVIGTARRRQKYLAPRGFDQTDIVEVADIEPKKGFSPLLAMNAYVQSALGMWMQDFISKLESKSNGTLITVFDSVTCEISPHSLDAYEKWVRRHISPFMTDGLQTGSTFFEAQYGKL